MRKGFGFKKNTFFGLLLIFPLIIVAEFYQFNILSGYAFGIINRMIGWLHSAFVPLDNSYAFPLFFHRLLKFLPFDTAFEWGIFWAIIMNVIFFIILLRKYKTYTLTEYIFIYASMFILDVFVFNINKDIVQCLIILILYEIALINIKNIYKLFMICVILFLESLFFRSYYILGALTTIIVYIVFNKTITNDKKSWLKASILILLLLFLCIYITQFIDSEAYNQLLGRRDTLEEDLDANTIISDMIPGDGYFNYCLNYLINLFRMLFPVELLFKGIKYIPFFVYQIFLTINILKNIKSLNKHNILNLSFVVGYWLMLFASESDFGTLVRHQAILLPFYLDIIRNNINNRKKLKGDGYEKN